MTVLSVVSIIAVAQQGPRNGNGQGRQYQERQGMGLNLTEDQQDKMDQLRLSVQKQMLPLKNELNEMKLECEPLQQLRMPT